MVNLNVQKNIYNVYGHGIFLDVFSLADERISVVKDKREEKLQANVHGQCTAESVKCNS